MAKIQIKRGDKNSLPLLAPGEFGLADDTDELFIGGNAGNLQIPIMGEGVTVLDQPEMLSMMLLFYSPAH